MIAISDVVKGWLGWCPQSRALPRQPPSIHFAAMNSSPDKSAAKPVVPSGLTRYRDRVLLFGILYSFAILAFAGSLYSVAPGALCIGILAGIVIVACFSGKIWQGFDRAVSNERKPKNGSDGYVILFLILGMILAAAALLLLAGFSIVPLETALELPALAMGFGLIPWYVLAIILLWERRTGYILLLDKTNGSITAVR